ncbi:hypothetical protein L1987_61890 [Smallanthus sonchifolius]|uniref:Uncharacterized protein n=1 Tax=Smallanthus sonchifolius TaxID=185202 RepID=A0ACB9C923_9ASTR|nr:hypothetical protein L1987_61890 [Smallanthus sonchifolius]
MIADGSPRTAISVTDHVSDVFSFPMEPDRRYDLVLEDHGGGDDFFDHSQMTKNTPPPHTPVSYRGCKLRGASVHRLVNLS